MLRSVSEGQELGIKAEESEVREGRKGTFAFDLQIFSKKCNKDTAALSAFLLRIPTTAKLASHF